MKRIFIWHFPTAIIPFTNNNNEKKISQYFVHSIAYFMCANIRLTDNMRRNTTHKRTDIKITLISSQPNNNDCEFRFPHIAQANCYMSFLQQVLFFLAPWRRRKQWSTYAELQTHKANHSQVIRRQAHKGVIDAKKKLHRKTYRSMLPSC